MKVSALNGRKREKEERKNGDAPMMPRNFAGNHGSFDKSAGNIKCLN